MHPQAVMELRTACLVRIVCGRIIWSSSSVYGIAPGFRGLVSVTASCRYVGKRLIPVDPATGALAPISGGCGRGQEFGPHGPPRIARREIMMKFATAAVFCSAGLILCSETAEARCGCKKSCCSSAPATCCAPAPTCAAPAPSCCAPAAPSCCAPAAPAAPGDAAPPAPAPTAGSGYGNPAVAMDGRQSYRSYSYNPAPAASGAVSSAPKRSRAGWDNIGHADRKMLGYY
jgi:hypothetical protein